MRSLRLLVAATAFVAAQAAGAQNIKFQSAPGSSPQVYGYYVGPFTGTLIGYPGQSVIDLFCLDVANHVTWGQTWTANFTNLGSDLSATRFGNAGLETYKKAAWLSTYYQGATVAETGSLQAAIWQLFNPGSPNGGAEELAWLAMVNGAAASTDWNDFDFSRYTIVTDVNAAGLRIGGVQEFITPHAVTPEPGALLLLGTGLVGIVGLIGYRAVRAD